MNPRDIRFFIEPGRLPGRVGRVRIWLRAVHRLGRSIVLVGIGACGGAVVAVVLMR